MVFSYMRISAVPPDVVELQPATSVLLLAIGGNKNQLNGGKRK